MPKRVTKTRLMRKRALSTPPPICISQITTTCFCEYTSCDGTEQFPDYDESGDDYQSCMDHLHDNDPAEATCTYTEIGTGAEATDTSDTCPTADGRVKLWLPNPTSPRVWATLSPTFSAATGSTSTIGTWDFTPAPGTPNRFTLINQNWISTNPATWQVILTFRLVYIDQGASAIDISLTANANFPEPAPTFVENTFATSP